METENSQNTGEKALKDKGDSVQLLVRCPKCGDAGYFEKRICKYEQYFYANGSVMDASDIETIRGGERKFCAKCYRDITKQYKAAN